MPSVSGTVYHGDGSPASGRRVSGLAAGMMGGTIGPTSTDSRGRFVLSWNSSTTTLAKLYVDGNVVRQNVHAGEDVPVRL
jgi:hypothetical protein